MVKKKGAEKKDATNANDVINTATSAASGVPKPIIDAATKPPTPAKPKPPQEPEPLEPEVAGGTAKVGEKKKQKRK